MWQVIRTKRIDQVGQVVPCLPWERSSTFCVGPMWRNERKWKSILMLLRIYSAAAGLRQEVTSLLAENYPHIPAWISWGRRTPWDPYSQICGGGMANKSINAIKQFLWCLGNYQLQFYLNDDANMDRVNSYLFLIHCFESKYVIA